MKRRKHVRYKRRTIRSALRKAQIARKEARKREKYPMQAVYGHRAIMLPRPGQRGA